MGVTQVLRKLGCPERAARESSFMFRVPDDPQGTADFMASEQARHGGRFVSMFSGMPSPKGDATPGTLQSRWSALPRQSEWRMSRMEHSVMSGAITGERLQTAVETLEGFYRIDGLECLSVLRGVGILSLDNMVSFYTAKGRAALGLERAPPRYIDRTAESLAGRLGGSPRIAAMCPMERATRIREELVSLGVSPRMEFVHRGHNYDAVIVGGTPRKPDVAMLEAAELIHRDGILAFPGFGCPLYRPDILGREEALRLAPSMRRRGRISDWPAALTAIHDALMEHRRVPYRGAPGDNDLPDLLPVGGTPGGIPGFVSGGPKPEPGGKP